MINRFYGVVILLVGLLNFSLLARPISLCDEKKIGEQIWLNETNKQRQNLVFWHPNESFPSLGIGHFTWMPQGQKGCKSKQFSLLCAYLVQHGVTLPPWLKASYKQGAPWSSRTDFLKDTIRRKELVDLLSSTIDLQTSFMIKRLEQEWAIILEGAPPKHKEKITNYFMMMRSTLLGTYALVDYLNFKGSGKQWGLLGVMQKLPENLIKSNITKAFAISAAEILTIRIKNTGPEYNQLKFLPGWIKRVHTYGEDKLFGA